MNHIITIDGPSASGKTSVARLVAKSLGVPYVSSGLLYRAVALVCLLENVGAQGVEERLERHDLRLDPAPDQNHVLLDGHDVTEGLHSLEVDSVVSAVAVRPAVREHVNRALRKIPAPFVIDGRDMGSTVFPQAGHKFFLTARPEVRAARRVPERGAAFDAVLADLLRRDDADKAQSAPAKDAVILDTSELSLEQVVGAILKQIR